MLLTCPSCFPSVCPGCEIYCSIRDYLSGINTFVCTDGLACASVDGQGGSVHPISGALFMGRITSGGAVWAHHNSNADDRDRHVTNCDSACCGLDFDLAVQAGT